jgi:hypothetical protein
MFSGQDAGAEIFDHNDPPDAGSAPITIRDTIPPQSAGGMDVIPVAGTVSVAVLVSSTYGVDLTNPDSIRFRIDDERLPIYERNLSADSVRIVKLNEDDDSGATLFWAVYDRSLEVDLPAAYGADAIVSVGVDIEDTATNILATAEFDFIIESEQASTNTAENMPQTAPINPSDPMLSGYYDSGIKVLEGPLKGAKIIYSSLEPIPPVIGPLLDMAELEADEAQAVGLPLNLMPYTVFDTPVKVFLPVPDAVETDDLGVYFHNGLEWQAGCDPAGDVSDAALGWMVPESRVIHDDPEPALIGIAVHHFSAAQTVVFARFSGDREDDEIHNSSGGTVYVSCFIRSIASPNPFSLKLPLILFVFLATIYSLKKTIALHYRKK